jgi:hypothetical protein
MSSSSRSLSRALRQHLLHPVALAYLALVTAVGIWVGVDTFIVNTEASFAGVWLFMVTAPTSLLFVALPGELFWTGIIVGALFQACVLSAAYRWVFVRPTRGGRLGSV